MRTAYRVTENRMLRDQLKGRVRLVSPLASDTEVASTLTDSLNSTAVPADFLDWEDVANRLLDLYDTAERTGTCQ